MHTSRVICCALLLSAALHAGEKKVMHCFAWTPIKTATSTEWGAFYQASEELPKKINGLTKIWYGKLASPLAQTTIAKIDPEARKKLGAGETVTAEIGRTTRDYGMCMEFDSPEALKAYATDPYHKVWADAYAKVRVEGTTTFNILGQ